MEESSIPIQTKFKLYICGPIAGYNNFNQEAFSAAASFLKTLGFDTVDPHEVSPFDHEGPCPGKDYAVDQGQAHTSHCYMRTDLQALLECDGIFVLAGWQNSVGSKLEIQVATSCGLPVFFQEPSTIGGYLAQQEALIVAERQHQSQS